MNSSQTSGYRYIVTTLMLSGLLTSHAFSEADGSPRYSEECAAGKYDGPKSIAACIDEKLEENKNFSIVDFMSHIGFNCVFHNYRLYRSNQNLKSHQCRYSSAKNQNSRLFHEESWLDKRKDIFVFNISIYEKGGIKFDYAYHKTD